uniref:Uncharacterized protein n=1 Tax=Alexandrium monilatum TaxID=311494 RepID=A0A7S4VLB1_9DINO
MAGSACGDMARLYEFTAMIGFAYRKHRRSLPKDISYATYCLLREIQSVVLPSAEEPLAGNVARARKDHQCLLSKLAALAAPAGRGPSPAPAAPGPAVLPVRLQVFEPLAEAPVPAMLEEAAHVSKIPLQERSLHLHGEEIPAGEVAMDRRACITEAGQAAYKEPSLTLTNSLTQPRTVPTSRPPCPSRGGSAVTSSTPIPRVGSAARPSAGTAASWRARSSSTTSSSGEDEGTDMPELVPPLWCSVCRVALCCPTCEECILCDKCHCDDACLAQPSEPPG